MLDKNFSRRGFIPLFVLLAIGVVVLFGGAYIVRQQFLKEGKSGKTTYDEAKIKEQIKNPQKLPEIKEEPKGEPAPASFVYQPKSSASAVSTASAEPAFSINPPAGWDNMGGNTTFKVRFQSPEEDREEQESGLYAKSHPQISIAVGRADGTLEDFAALVKKTKPAAFDKMTIVSERKTVFAGQEAYRFEVELTAKGVGLYSLDYYVAKDGYFVHLAGTAIKSFWNRREPAISGSLATFKFL